MVPQRVWQRVHAQEAALLDISAHPLPRARQLKIVLHLAHQLVLSKNITVQQASHLARRPVRDSIQEFLTAMECVLMLLLRNGKPRIANALLYVLLDTPAKTVLRPLTSAGRKLTASNVIA